MFLNRGVSSLTVLAQLKLFMDMKALLIITNCYSMSVHDSNSGLPCHGEFNRVKLKVDPDSFLPNFNIDAY